MVDTFRVRLQSSVDNCVQLLYLVYYTTKESRDTAYQYFSRQPDENRAISLELLIKSKRCIARQIANQFWSGCLLISAKHVTIYLLT